MKLLEEIEVQLQLSDLHNRSPLFQPHKNNILTVRERAQIPHLMEILRRCAIDARILKPGEPLETDLPNRMMLGMAFEEFAASMYPEMIWQPGEQVTDGVAMNADGLSVINRVADSVLAVEEFKYTAKKIRTGAEILKERLYIWQMQGYCKGYNARLARLHVMYAYGDYGKRRDPVYMRYLIEFSEADVESTWALIRRCKDRS